MQTGSLRVVVLVLQLFLQFALLRGRLPRVFGRGWRVDVGLLIHATSPPELRLVLFTENLPNYLIRNRTVSERSVGGDPEPFHACTALPAVCQYIAIWFAVF